MVSTPQSMYTTVNVHTTPGTTVYTGHIVHTKMCFGVIPRHHPLTRKMVWLDKSFGLVHTSVTWQIL